MGLVPRPLTGDFRTDVAALRSYRPRSKRWQARIDRMEEAYEEQGGGRMRTNEKVERAVGRDGGGRERVAAIEADREEKDAAPDEAIEEALDRATETPEVENR